MDWEIVIYGIIGALAILVCWLLDVYAERMGKESTGMSLTELVRSGEKEVILPTCCICQKIRDDRGNWQERNEFQEDCRGAVFSHTVCQECALKHYAEFYQGTELPGTSPY